MVSPYTDEKKSQESSSFMIFTRALFIFDSITTYFSFEFFNFEIGMFLTTKILQIFNFDVELLILLQNVHLEN